MRNKTGLLLLLIMLFPLATLSASAAITPPHAAGAAPQSAPASVLGSPGVAAGEAPTEGGIVFYNRKLIAETMGKTRQLLLTFDDGPNPHTTPMVLDILKRWNLKGIFFVVGMNVRKYPSLVKRIFDEGHTIGNHTYYHLNLRLFPAERITREIRETNDLIAQITGVRPRLFRPPYGAMNSTVINVLRQEGMDIMLWTFDPRDWRSKNMNQTMASLRKQLHLEMGGKGGVILLHDPLPSTVAALEPLLTSLAQCNLLPTAYHRDMPHGRGFWAMKGPNLLHEFAIMGRFHPENAGRRLLTAYLAPPPAADYSAVALLRAKKSGNLFTALFCRSF